MQGEMKDMMESQIGFLVSRMEVNRKADKEEIKATIQSIWSELDEMRVENIMKRINVCM
jgi:ribosomal protein L23